MSQLVDKAGQRIGRLVILSRASKQGEKLRWLCLCDCGNRVVRANTNLRNDNTRSCGCLRSEMVSAKNTTHGKTSTRAYRSWCHMIERCTNPKNKDFHHYGGRGIAVCKRWMKFENFFYDMGERPPRLTLERENNDLGYFPSNCKWATQKEQCNNRRSRWRNHVRSAT